MYKYVKHIYCRNKLHAKYVTIDPGIRNIGWCYASYSPYSLLDIGHATYAKVLDDNDNDLRLVLVAQLIEMLILKYTPDFVVMEKIKFITGKYSFSECLLIKAIGIIECTVLKHNITLISLGNRTSQVIIFGKSKIKSNKENMQQYVLYNDNIFIRPDMKNTISQKKYRDISDAIFISYAIYISILEYKKLYDL